MNKAELFKKRIGFKGPLEDISIAVCKQYGLGAFVSNKLVTVGYEDFNFSLNTSKGIFFVKIFANFRTLSDCKRYVEMIEEALAKKVHTPKLLKSRYGYLNIVKANGRKLRLVVMDFIDGKSMFESRIKLNQKEVKFLAKQAVRVNLMGVKPKFVYDHWAVIHFLKEFRKTKRFLTASDLALVAPLIKEFKELKIDTLPHCFVHGDIITTNIIKDKKGKLWIIDFSVANYYPRINELAVMICNTFFDPKSKARTDKNFKIAVKEYQKITPLTQRELKALPVYVKLAYGMHMLGPTYQKFKKGNKTSENNYWLKQGRAGLLQTKNLAKKCST
ncbi:MAG: phosphotransferase [archaeon]